MKKLKIGDLVIAVFLGTPSECEVIELIGNQLYKLKMKSGTILPGVTWLSLLDVKQKKTKPWHILKYIRHTEHKVIEDNTNIRADLDQAIIKQKKFIRGEIIK